MKKIVKLSLATIIAIVAFCSAGVCSDKLTYRYDFKRSGYAQSEIHPPLVLKWFYDTNLEKGDVYVTSSYSDESNKNKKHEKLGTQNADLIDLNNNSDAKDTEAAAVFTTAVLVSGLFLHDPNLEKRPAYNARTTASIIGEGEMLYFGALANTFCAFDTIKMECKWRHKTDGAVQASATISKDKIFFGDTKGYLYSLKKESGKLLWKYKAKSEIVSSPAVIGEKIFFTDMGETIYSLSAERGAVLWKAELGNVSGKIIVRNPTALSYNENGFLYQGLSDGYLYCLDQNSAKELFRKKIKSEGAGGLFDASAPVGIDDDAVYSSSYDGTFMAISKDKPDAKWELKLKGSGIAAFNKDALIIASNEGFLYKVDKNFGNIIWEQKLSANLTAPVINDKYVFLASGDYFYVVNISNGKVEYEYEPGSGISSEICVLNDAVYFLSNKGVMYCFK